MSARRRGVHWLLAETLRLLMLLAALPAAAALRFEAPLSGLDAQQQAFTQAVLTTAEQRLPPVVRAELDVVVPVRWVDDLPAGVAGRATGNGRVLLAQRLLQEGDQALALRTLLHEVIHLYDRLGPPPALRWRCASRVQVQGLVGLPAVCRGQGQRQRRLSDDPRLLDLAGWPERVGTRGQREQQNAQTLRSPDPYELDSPAEFVAVNAEYFLLDAEYACRRPALHAYFTAQFAGWAPPTARCSQRYPYLNAGANAEQSLLGWLDPERVYAVHYLLAEPNDDWASRWGHSMLRLVVCAPGRERGPGCLLDVEQHLVMSFRAFVDDVQLSHWDGLVGSYPSRLFLLPLSQVVDEYTKLELRALRSVPLRFGRAQIAGVVRQAAQLHWSYDGRYYFIGNNCAVETLKLLRAGSNSAVLRDLDSQTPIGLLQLLEARGLADTSVLTDPVLALRQGYRFDSYAERYQQLFAPLREQLGLPAADVAGWLDLSASRRRDWFAGADLRASAALLLLEQAALRRQLLRVQQRIKLQYLQGDGPAAMQQAGDLVASLLRERGFLSRPADLVSAGYGLPQPAEWQDLAVRSEAQQQRLIGLGGSLDALLPSLLPAAERAELDAAQDNLQQLLARIRQQRRDSSGD